MRIPDAFLTDLRQRVDIVDVVSEYVTLRRSGRNLTGLCPFHNERTPSFSVSAEKQFFHCFGCGASGNVIQFLMDIEGLAFPDAVKSIANRVGIELPYATPEAKPQSTDESARRQRMKDAHELAAKWYSYILMNSSAGVQALMYLDKRGLVKTTIAQFRLGYAPANKQGVVQFLLTRGFEQEILIESGLAVAYGNEVVDRFRNRVMIPISDAQGSVVAFGGRALTDELKPKYLNSPETPIFHKSQLLFNQHQARKAIRAERTAILMEGYMDVLSAYQAGVQNVVASLGTAFSSEQASLLKRYSENLVIAYDGDNAGITAAYKALLEAKAAEISSRVLVLPDGEDPDGYIRRFGADAFREHMASSTLTPIQFSIYKLKRSAELRSLAGRQSYMRSVLSILANGATPIEVETEIRQLALDHQISVDALKEEFSQLSKELDRGVHRNAPPRVESVSRVPAVTGDVLAGQRVLHAMMSDRKSFDYLMETGVDELAVAEQTALLALGYSFFSTQPQASSTDFVESIEDSDLRRMAIAILMLDDTPAPTPEVLRDYLRTIELQKVMDQWRVAIEAWKEAVRRQDQTGVESCKQRMDALAAEVERLKSTPQPIVR